MTIESRIPKQAGKASRSAMMVECLRSHYLYCEKKARDIVFEVIEEAVQNTGGRRLLLHRLRRACAARARALGLRRGYEYTNWEIGTRTTLHAMLQSGSLLTHGGRVMTAGIASEAIEVKALQPDFRDRTESFLLGFIIRELGDVSTRDHTALAHALFRQFDTSVSVEEMEDRVAILLARLAHTVALTTHGTYVSC